MSSKRKILFSRSCSIFFILFIGYFVALSCSTTPRMPTSINLDRSLYKEVPVEAIEQIQAEYLTKNKIDNSNCETSTQHILAIFEDWAPAKSELQTIKKSGVKILQKNFELRLHLHRQLSGLNTTCLQAMKKVFLNLRAFEDTLALHIYEDKQVQADEIKFAEQPIPLIESDKYRPYFYNSKVVTEARLKSVKNQERHMSQAPFYDYKEGDIMITKGVSLISGTISSSPEPQSLFSHIVFVAKHFETYEERKIKEAKIKKEKNDKLLAEQKEKNANSVYDRYPSPKSNKKDSFHQTDFVNANGLGTLESYIGSGVNFFTMKDALLNENARILVLRAKDQSLAKKAHDYITNRVINTANYKVEEEIKYRAGELSESALSESLESMAEKRNIKYDYDQDFSNNTAMSCEEVAFDAFKTASKGQMIIPAASAQVLLKDKKMLKAMGLHQGEMMFPADMEVDPRFEIVLDWTDYRLIRDNWRKDAIMSEVFRWVNEEGYVMNTSGPAALGGLAWMGRELKFLWPLLSKITSIPENWEKGVPADGIKMVGNFKDAGGKILDKVKKLDEDFYKKNQRWMTRSELRFAINQVRLLDLQEYRHKGISMFHSYFRPINENYVNPIKGD